MGYMTTIHFLNDAYSNIKDNPNEVIENILDAMNNTSIHMKTYGVGNCCNPMVSSRTEHADIPRLYLCWRNSMLEVGKNYGFSSLETRRSFLAQAKRILKEEEEILKKMEGKLKINSVDLSFHAAESRCFGKYAVTRKGYEDSYMVYEGSTCVFNGNSKETVEFVNKQVPERTKKGVKK